jgi:hypothetical protein
MEEKNRVLAWDYSIPLYSRFIALDCLKAFGIPFGIIACFFAFSIYSQKEHGGTISWYGLNYALIFVGILIALTMLLLWILYRNRFESHFIINKDGVGVAYRGGTSQKNKTVNTLLIVLGAFAKKPGMVGTGLISQSMQSVSVEWCDIFKVVTFPKLRTIHLRNNWRQVMVVYCTKEIYEEALEWINQEVDQRKYDRAKDRKTIRKERNFGWTMTPFVLLFGFFLSAVYEYDFDSKIFMFLVAGWVMLTIWVPTWIKKPAAIVGFIVTAIYWIWGFSVIMDSYVSMDERIRALFMSLGCIGLLGILILCFQRKE